MEYEEIVVKESPGLCRCCLSEGCYKDLGTEYTWMNEAEIYADMLLECFDISITQHNDGPNGPNRLICEVCITRLRDACNFKKQVLDAEKKFVDMMGRGEFRPKMLIYQAQLKTENTLEEMPADEANIEYLEEDIDFDDGLLNDDPAEPSLSEDITVTSLPVKAKRGRPRKSSTIVKPEKKAKVPKLDDKPRTSKAPSKVTHKFATRLLKRRAPSPNIPLKRPRNVMETKKAELLKYVRAVLKASTVIPFKWYGNKFLCFYCYETFHEASKLQEHTREKHKDTAVVKDLPREPIIKLDVSRTACLKCNLKVSNLEELLKHLKVHKLIDTVNQSCFLQFQLKDAPIPCLMCQKKFNFFGTLYSHMNKDHLEGTKRVCELCGQDFFSLYSHQQHVRKYHMKEDFKCRYCDAEFKVEAKRISHEYKKHDIKIYQCYKCPEMFGSRYLRKLHLSSVHSTSTGFSCEHCGKTFVHKCLLLRHHRRAHFKEKTWECSSCGAKFAEQRTLKKHMLKHRGQIVPMSELYY